MLVVVVNAWVGMYQTVVTTDYPQGEYKTAADVTCHHPMRRVIVVATIIPQPCK